MDADITFGSGRVIPAGELRWTFARSSGPGGQSVNTTDSQARLAWNVHDSVALTAGERRRVTSRLAARMSGPDLVVTASEQRSQWQNRQAARRRLADLVAGALRPDPPPRRPTRPTRSSQHRRLRAKTRRSQVKQNRRRPDGSD